MSIQCQPQINVFYLLVNGPCPALLIKNADCTFVESLCGLVLVLQTQGSTQTVLLASKTNCLCVRDSMQKVKSLLPLVHLTDVVKGPVMTNGPLFLKSVCRDYLNPFYCLQKGKITKKPFQKEEKEHNNFLTS